MNNSVHVTPKGLAVVAAIDAGLVEETDDGYNTDKFELFWQAYTSALMQYPGYEIQSSPTLRESAKEDSMIYSTILQGPNTGLALVFPPEWPPERVAAVLSKLDATVTVSKCYIVKNPEEIRGSLGRAAELAEADAAPDEERLYHFKDGAS